MKPPTVGTLSLLGAAALKSRLFLPPTRPVHRLLAGDVLSRQGDKGTKFYETRTARTGRPWLRLR